MRRNSRSVLKIIVLFVLLFAPVLVFGGITPPQVGSSNPPVEITPTMEYESKITLALNDQSYLISGAEAKQQLRRLKKLYKEADLTVAKRYEKQIVENRDKIIDYCITKDWIQSDSHKKLALWWQLPLQEIN